MSGDSISWFHGGISRDQAIQILERNKKHGLFLVRESTKIPGDYVLSIWHDKNGYQHFQIHCVGDSHFSIDDGPIFSGLDVLISHYQCEADGLPVRLSDFCPGTRPPAASLKYGEDTELHRACLRGNLLDIRNVLLQRTVDVNARNTAGSTCLHDASSKGNEDIINLLLEFGADVKCRDNNELTPLQCACVNGHAGTCSRLIQAGSDVQDRCPVSGFVPLHYAAKYGFLEVVKVLIASGATLHPRTPEGDTPRDLALRYGHFAIADYIDNFPIPPPKTNTSQWLHENLSRKNAVDLLNKFGMTNGLFLVRSSMREHGVYVLTLAGPSQVYNFEIRSRADRWFYIDDGPLFETLPHVIDHYSKCADGLPLLLQCAIPPSGHPIPIGRDKVIPSNTVGRRTSAPLPPPYSGHERERSLNRSISHQPSSLQSTRPGVARSLSGQDGVDGPKNDAKVNQSRRPAPPLPPPSPPPTPLKPITPKRQAPPVPPTRHEPQQQTLILRSSLEFDKELGQGEFGSVIKGTWTDPQGNQMPVALKTLHPEKIASGEPEFLREARVMSGLDHPCIVRLIGVCLGPPLILVQELVDMGALLDYLIDFQHEILPSDLKLWAAQIAWGMTYLEKKRFVHRDLATRNILLKTKDQLKISDFGLSRAVGSGSDYYKASQGGRWPVKWYAPESINYGTFSHKSDVWSYGVTLWEMYSFGQLPYGDMTGAEVIKMLETEGKRLEKPEGCPDHIYSLMLRCWDLTPDNRPKFEELHKVFSTDPLYADVKLPKHLADKWKS